MAFFEVSPMNRLILPVFINLPKMLDLSKEPEVVEGANLRLVRSDGKN